MMVASLSFLRFFSHGQFNFVENTPWKAPPFSAYAKTQSGICSNGIGRIVATKPLPLGAT
jgi:hypothetical protein